MCKAKLMCFYVNDNFKVLKVSRVRYTTLFSAAAAAFSEVRDFIDKV